MGNFFSIGFFLRMAGALLLLVTGFLPEGVQAQEITISEEINLRNDIAYDILGPFKGRMLVFRDRGNSFEVHGYNEQLSKTWEKEIFLGERAPAVVCVVNQDSNFVIAHTFRNRSETILYATKFNPAADAVDTLLINRFGYSSSAVDFFWALSEDENFLLLYSSPRPTELEAYMIRLDSMQLHWTRRFESDDFNFDREFIQAVPDNRGNMHMVVETNNFRSNKGHFMDFIRVGSSEGPLQRSRVELGDYITYDLSFAYDNLNDQLIGVGLWSDGAFDRANGYYYIRLKPTGESRPFAAFREFTEAFIRTYHGKKVRKKKGLVEATIQDLVLRRDGGLLLIGERNRVLERWAGTTSPFMYDGFSRVSSLDHFFEDIFVVSIHPDGELHWATVLPKKQYSQNDGGVYSSFFLMKTPSSLRLIFNDEIRAETTVSEYVLTGTGKSDRNGLISTERLDLKLRFRDALQISSEELIVPSERRNDLKLVRMSF